MSTGTLGGGQEVTVLSSMSVLAAHGITYVPLGYKPAFATMSDLSEVHGGSPWGAGTLAVGHASDNDFTVTDIHCAGRRWVTPALGEGVRGGFRSGQGVL